MGLFDVTQMGLEDARPETLVAADQEYKLRIVSFKEDLNKNGDPYGMPRFEIVGEPYAREISMYLPAVTKAMDEKERNRTRNRITDFMKCFGLQPTENPEDDWVGKEGWVILGVRPSNFADDGQENFIKRFIAPK